MDRTQSFAYYIIDVDLETRLPKSIKLTLLTGVRGVDLRKDLNQEHVAFHFDYKLNGINEVVAFDVPKGAQKLLR